MMSTSRLRDLIRSIRECKTAAEERALVAKESASLRASFKSDSVEHRHRNVAKLMYLHMLGYPTHFGQMECLKLIAGNGFPEKRIGYLGLMALLDERQEILMLVTNSLKRDLYHKNQYVIGLALCALGNICSAEMARDLAPDVKKLMRSSTIYIKKKAAICAVRLLQKVPELVEDFRDAALALLEERSHGVLLGAVTLALEMCVMEPQAVEWFRTRAVNLVKIMKHLATAGFTSAEHTVRGVPDPFLQVKVLNLLRLLGKGNTELSDAMGDVLAQVATNTDGSKNVGNAILYECAQTIIETESIGGLRVLAVNILGKFLANRDNNMRYVALHTLTKVVAIDPKAVQRHKNVIVQCVKDSDVSIRKRALELACALVNDTNIEAFMKELLQFVADSEPAFRSELVDKVCSLVERFAPSPRWHVDVMAHLFEEAGTHIKEHAARAFVVMVSATPSIQGYAVRTLYRILYDNLDKQSSPMLVTVAVWMVGEFGQALLGGEAMMDGEMPLKVTEQELVSLVEQIMRLHCTSVLVMEYALTCLMKVSERCPSQSERIKALIAKHKRSAFLELQQRACEFDRLFLHDKIRGQLLEQMPAMLSEEGTEAAAETSGASASAGAGVGLGADQGVGLDLLNGGDLLGLDGGASGMPAAGSGADSLADLLGDTTIAPGAPSAAASSAGAPAATDALMDLMGGAPGPSPTPTPASAPAGGMGGMGGMGGGALDLMGDLMGGAMAAPSSAAAPAPAVAFPDLQAYERNGVSITFAFAKPAPNAAVVTATYKNGGAAPVSRFLVQAAVPKYITLKLEPASGTELPPYGMGQIVQRINLTNAMQGQKPLMLRLKVEYAINGAPVSEMVEVKTFPPGL